MRILGIAACLIMLGCSVGAARGAPPMLDDSRDKDWRRVATPADRGRLRNWRGAWMDALAQVDPREIANDVQLFDPDRSLTKAVPPSGAYRCRTFKLGARGGIGPTFAASSAFACRVDESREGDVVSLVKLDGSQRPVGTIFTDTDSRAIFLGTMEFGDETRPLRYGRDAGRDVAGLIERIGARRWRVVLPYPRFGSVLDVVELVPAP